MDSYTYIYSPISINHQSNSFGRLSLTQEYIYIFSYSYTMFSLLHYLHNIIACHRLFKVKKAANNINICSMFKRKFIS